MSARTHERAKKDRRGQNRTARRRKTSPRSSRLSNARQLTKLRKWLLPNDGIFVALRLHGNTKWTPAALVWLALCWAWQETRNVTDAFEMALAQCQQQGVAPLGSYQGFMPALVRWTEPLMDVLWPHLHELMKQIGGEFFEIAGFVPLGFDGAREAAPRTESNEKELCAPNYGKGSTAKYRKKKTKGMRRTKNEKHKPQPQEPQVWSTLIWHMGLRLPWMWRLGPSNASERDHVKEMVDAGDFPEKTLFCGDAGFVGFPLWNQILSHGCHFLVRIGANVNLLSETCDCTFEKNGRVLCWPEAAMRSGQAPLRLRTEQVKVGDTWMWMLTSVLVPSQLSRKQIARFYKMRWGIEIEWRGLKQTLDRAKLKCRNAQRLLAELSWSIMAMTVAELFALKQQLAAHSDTLPQANDPPADPQKRSLANTMRALRRCLINLPDVPAPGKDLLTLLRYAVTDSYNRKSSKRARYCPLNPDKKPLGNPKIRTLTLRDKKKLAALIPKITV
jgi:hypothetical protein